jgi:hypothetical protein
MTQAVRDYVGAWTVWFMAGHDHPYPSNELTNLNTSEYFKAIAITEQIKPILVMAMTGVLKTEYDIINSNATCYYEEPINVE